MLFGKVIRTSIVAVALCGLVSSPAFADRGKKDNGKKFGHSKSAPPKKNGRHDNRDWNKKRNNPPVVFRSSDAKVIDSAIARFGGSPQAALDRESARRQQTKNEWRNIAIASGAVAVLGLLNKDNRLVFAGTAGTLYSLYRYEQDRKSQRTVDRLRAQYFSRPYFYRNGVRYERRLVTKNGQKYYQFVRKN